MEKLFVQQCNNILYCLLLGNFTHPPPNKFYIENFQKTTMIPIHKSLTINTLKFHKMDLSS